MQYWCLEKLTSGELWKSSRCPHHAPGGTGKPAALQALGPTATSHLPWMPWRSALFCRAEPMAKATNWGHTPHFQGQSPSVGTYHKKECSWLIRGFWIKSNTFKVQTQTLGPREQPVPMPGAAGGSQLTEHRLGLPQAHRWLQKCSFPQPLKQRNLFQNTAAFPYFEV